MATRYKILSINGKPKQRGQKPQAGDSIVYLTPNGGHLYTCWRPVRPSTMSPVEYYRKYRVVDDRYHHVHKGRYYCNPAHCKQSWTDKKKRDAHLDCAYAILG